MTDDLIPVDAAPSASSMLKLEQLAEAIKTYLADPGIINGATLRGTLYNLGEALQRESWQRVGPTMEGSKVRNLLQPDSCWNRAELNEPVFVLRGKDALAPAVVRLWASLATTTNAHDRAKAFAAYALSEQMDAWRLGHYGDELRVAGSEA